MALHETVGKLIPSLEIRFICRYRDLSPRFLALTIQQFPTSLRKGICNFRNEQTTISSLRLEERVSDRISSRDDINGINHLLND